MKTKERKIDDVNITGQTELVKPVALISKLPATEVFDFVYNARKKTKEIINGADDRLNVVVGPCSIHDEKVAMDYAKLLNEVQDKYQNELNLIMRVYFEKPRTTHGWKGLINDPGMDETYRINDGLLLARKILLEINQLGLACGVEYLDTISPQYIADLVTWGAIGARTTESQVHRELASGLSSAVGFKNGTDGNTMIAAHAILAANRSHHFLSVTKEGNTAIFHTRGNHHTHIILRGGSNKTNYDKDSVNATASTLAKLGLSTHLMIDCSHANSNKDHKKQIAVAKDVAEQIAQGDLRIIGVMLESNLVEGRQEISNDLTYGQSVTDACISWEQTLPVLDNLAQAVIERRNSQLDRE